MLREVISIVGRWVIGKARARVARLTDEQLRAIARAVIGAGARPLAPMLADARAMATAAGVELSDELERRLVEALANELARLRIPGQLDDLADKAQDVVDEFDAARKRGEAVTRARADNGEKE